MSQTIRDRIRIRMGELRLSATQVSLDAGLSRSLVGKFLRGDVEEMRDANLGAVARALGCTVAFLRGEADLAAALPYTDPAPVMNLVAVGPDTARVHLEGTVPFEIALAIMDLFRKGLAR